MFNVTLEHVYDLPWSRVRTLGNANVPAKTTHRVRCVSAVEGWSLGKSATRGLTVAGRAQVSTKGQNPVTTRAELEAELDARGYKLLVEDDLDGGPSLLMLSKYCHVCGLWQQHIKPYDDIYDPNASGLLLRRIIAGDCECTPTTH